MNEPGYERVTAQGYDYPKKVRNPFWGDGGGGGGGTTDYEALDNKPRINGVVLIGNKTSEDLHIKECDCEELTPEQLATILSEI